MTDLPELRDSLTRAAAAYNVKRSRRRAVRIATSSAVCLGVIALVVLALASVAQERDPEVAVPQPGTATEAPGLSAAVSRSYNVFKRPRRKSDGYPGRPPEGKVLRARLIGRDGPWRAHLAETESRLCLATFRGKVGGAGCGPKDAYLDGRTPLGNFSDEKGPSTIAFAFPDGVTTVSLRLDTGRLLNIPVRDNGFVRQIDNRPVEMSWTAPDGRTRKRRFGEAPAAPAPSTTPTPTPGPSPTATPTPAPTDQVRLRPVSRQRGEATLKIDRKSGWFAVKATALKRTGSRRAYGLWMRHKGAEPCRLGFLTPPRNGVTEGSGQLPKLRRGALFIISLDGSEKLKRPREVILQGRAALRIDGTGNRPLRCR